MENPGIFAEFRLDKFRNDFKSQEEGREVHEMREYIKIVIAGDKHSEVYRLATDTDRERFRDVYRRFREDEGAKSQIIGTHISAAPFLNAAQVADLQHLHVYTVEALAGLSDVAKQKLGMGAGELVAKAQAFLKVAEDSSFATKLAAEVERKDNEIADLRRQIGELAGTLQAMQQAANGNAPAAPAGGRRAAAAA